MIARGLNLRKDRHNRSKTVVVHGSLNVHNFNVICSNVTLDDWEKKMFWLILRYLEISHHVLPLI
jgi:hypothetical protein